MTFIIICAGSGERWNNYTGVPKHLVDIYGESMLKRTVRLLGTKDKIYIVVRDIKDKRYFAEGAETVEGKIDDSNRGADKFLSSKHLWDKKGRTVVLYGDVYFTEKALKAIIDYKDKDWVLLCRPFGSKYTGCPWPECFAQSFYPKDHKEHLDNLYKVRELRREEKITRCGGWEHYRAMCGINPGNYNDFPLKRLRIIDDMTEDFDYPRDYKRWKYTIDNNIKRWVYKKK